MTKKLSILILTYNRLGVASKYVPEILKNVGDIDCEILFWDNGSTDGTYDWLEQYKHTDQRISHVFGSEKNFGLESVNFLAKEAKGEYILKIDDDVEVPKRFAERLVKAYEEIKLEKLCFLGYDMAWGDKTFATRSGFRLYRQPLGEIKVLSNRTDKVYINYTPSKWMVNGVCRLSKRDVFLKIGGHPEGRIYGVDYEVSRRAEEHGYMVGFYNTKDLVIHHGTKDDKKLRELKDSQLRTYKVPKHV